MKPNLVSFVGRAGNGALLLGFLCLIDGLNVKDAQTYLDKRRDVYFTLA